MRYKFTTVSISLLVNSEKEMLSFQIAGIRLEIHGVQDRWLPGSAWKCFLSEDGQKGHPDIVMRILDKCSVDYQVEKYFCPSQAAFQQMFRFESDILFTNQDWSVCVVLPISRPTGFQVLSNHLFYSRGIGCGMLQFHASLIDIQGRGVLFLGPSGVGKTTQAERWAHFRGADILNGDIVFVQRAETEFLGWGTPWHGSSPYCLNTSVPVKALVVLKQAPYNALRELAGFEKVREVANHVFYPTWLDGGRELCTNILDRLLTQVPVYRLDNKADREAVELLERELNRIS